MQDRPTNSELIESVRDYLQTVAIPALSGHSAFHGRIAVNVLDIVLRDLRLGPGFDTAEQKRLAELLGQDDDLATLNRLFCQRLRNGEISGDDPAVRAHLRTTALERLSIDNPKYATYQRLVR